jgi:hypothetical protein
MREQRDDRSDLLDAETLTPTVRDDSKASKMMALEVAVGARSGDLPEQPLLGIEADRLDRHADRRRYFTDEHGSSSHRRFG